jgi:hypothetical protein
MKSTGTLTLPKERDHIKRVTGRFPLKSKFILAEIVVVLTLVHSKVQAVQSDC